MKNLVGTSLKLSRYQSDSKASMIYLSPLMKFKRKRLQSNLKKTKSMCVVQLYFLICLYPEDSSRGNMAWLEICTWCLLQSFNNILLSFPSFVMVLFFTQVRHFIVGLGSLGLFLWSTSTRKRMFLLRNSSSYTSTSFSSQLTVIEVCLHRFLCSNRRHISRLLCCTLRERRLNNRCCLVSQQICIFFYIWDCAE